MVICNHPTPLSQSKRAHTEYATIEQLLVLANIEGMNAEFIHMALPQGKRLKRLNEIAIRQMRVLTSATAINKLKGS
jgi:hypothetical protein